MSTRGASSSRIDRSPAREERRGGRGAIYRIKPDGLWDIIWESGRRFAVRPDVRQRRSSLVVGTGRGGKLFSLTGDPMTATLLMQASAQQVTGFARDAKGNIYLRDVESRKDFQALAAARGGRHLHLDSCAMRRRSSDWGTLSWRASVPAGSRVDVFTRSGNTATPDDTWSDWAGRMQHPEGDEITSPNARYLQWKAVLARQTGQPRADVGYCGVPAAKPAAHA